MKDKLPVLPPHSLHTCSGVRKRLLLILMSLLHVENALPQLYVLLNFCTVA